MDFCFFDVGGARNSLTQKLLKAEDALFLAAAAIIPVAIIAAKS